MNGYKIKQHNDQWYFELFPNNNHNQAIGRSMNYTSLEECQKAITKFRDFVEINNLNTPVEDKLIIKNESGRFTFQYMENSNVIFWRVYSYGTKKSCYKGIESIYRNIDVYTENCLNNAD